MYVSPFTIVSFFLGFPLCAFEFWLSLTFLSISYFMISKEQDGKQIFKFLPVYLYYTHIYLCYIFILHSPPLKLGGVLVFQIWTKRGVVKKLLSNRGVSWKGLGAGSLTKGGGGSKLLHQFSLRKACFHYYWNTFFVW